MQVLVKELRERTGAGMMDCKKALVETNGDATAAAELLRTTGQAKAEKKAGRIAAEGRVEIATDGAGRAVMLEINCETDFVAKDQNFLDFAATAASLALATGSANVDELLAAPAGSWRDTGRGPQESDRKDWREYCCAAAGSFDGSRCCWVNTVTAIGLA